MKLELFELLPWKGITTEFINFIVHNKNINSLMDWAKTKISPKFMNKTIEIAKNAFWLNTHICICSKYGTYLWFTNFHYPNLMQTLHVATFENSR